jgi:hypothetical protein
MTLFYAIRYFVIVGVVPPLFMVGFVVAVAAAAVRLTSNPATAVDALTPVLLLQLFVAGSGFRLPARRGHFDLLLTSGTPRSQIALAHCLVSIAPGIVSWLCVGLLELAASHASLSASFAAGTCAAVVTSSIVAWGTAVYSSRTAGAIGWLLVMTIPPVARLVSPLRLLGVAAGSFDTFAIVSVLWAAVLPLVTGIWCIVRGVTPLEATQ